MRNYLVAIIILSASILKAQTLQFMNVDSNVIEDVMISDLTKNESVYSDKEGKADISIFEEDQVLQIEHPDFETMVVSKADLSLEKIFFLMENGAIKIDAVEIPIISRTKETKYELITQSTSISRQKNEQQAPATSADMLENTGQVLIQKSQLGGGSPIIRGFEASRVLLVVDGVRMNNAIYRSGHLQNAITVDPSLLEGTEIIFGPNSLIYGSDALGGVIHFKTKDPSLSTDSNSLKKIGGFLRYQSASSAKVANLHANYATEHWGFYASVTQSQFGDLRMGANRTHGYDDFGKIPYFVNQFNGVDSMVANSDPNLQVNTGYGQTDALAKILFQPKKGYVFKFNTQLSTSTNIPRFDKLNEYKEGGLRFAEWDYGPQNRSLMSLSAEIEEHTKFFDFNNTIIARQSIEEDRISREFGSINREHQEENVIVYSLNSDFIKYLDSSETIKLNYGVELLWNDVASKAYIENIETGILWPHETRYPGLGSTYGAAAGYVAAQKKWKKHLLKGGARYSLSKIDAKFQPNAIVDLLNLKEVELFNQAITSSVGYVYHSGNHKLYSSISSAYKAPNIDDFGKIFEKKGNLTIPNVDLKPETSLSGEIGTSCSGNKIQYDVAAFYTRVFDIMVKEEVTLNGASTFIENTDTFNLVSNVNNGIADIYGGFASVKLKLSTHFSLASTATFTKANFVNNNDPVPHIPPFYGRTSLDYTKGKVKLSFYGKYNGLKQWDEFSDLTDNPDESIENVGSPAWYTLNASIFTYPMEKMRIQIAVENILDAHYKPFASGISAPGRNIMGTMYFTF